MAEPTVTISLGSVQALVTITASLVGIVAVLVKGACWYMGKATREIMREETVRLTEQTIDPLRKDLRDLRDAVVLNTPERVRHVPHIGVGE